MPPSTAPHKEEYRPGDAAPEAGIYEVVHAAHRPPHMAILLRGESFPSCRSCKDAVRFRLSRRADHVSGDTDLGAPE